MPNLLLSGRAQQLHGPLSLCCCQRFPGPSRNSLLERRQAKPEGRLLSPRPSSFSMKNKSTSQSPKAFSLPSKFLSRTRRQINMTNFYNISGEYVKKCCLAQWNGIRKRKCSVIREDASQFWGFQARAEIDIQTRRIHIRTLSCFPFLPIGLDSHFDLLRLLSQSPYEQPGINEGVHSAPSRASVDSICWLYRTKDLPYHESHIRFVWGSHTSCSL